MYPSNDFLRIFKSTAGALSVSESICIMNIAAQAPEGGVYVEYGTHKGKSAMSAIYGLKRASFYLNDIIFSDNDIVKEVAASIKDAVGYDVELRFYQGESLKVIPELNNYSYVFIDTAAHDNMVMEEVKMIEDKVIQNGIIAFHDYLNQFSAVERAYNYLISTGKYEPIQINWNEIFEYVKENNLEECNNSWHLYPELPHPPNFIGALRRK